MGAEVQAARGSAQRAKVARDEIDGLLRAADAYRANRGFNTAQAPVVR